MAKFTKYSGFKNTNSARANFAPLKKRILEMAGEDGLTIPPQVSRSLHYLEHPLCKEAVRGLSMTIHGGTKALLQIQKRVLFKKAFTNPHSATQAARSKGKRKSNADGNAAEVAGSDGANPDDTPANKPSSAPAKKARISKKNQAVKSEEGAQDDQAKASVKADTPAKKRGAPAKVEAVKEEAASEEDAKKEEETIESS